jgi:hypothetical protein
MKGTLAVTDRGRLCERPWDAQRDKVNLAGQWEWTCATAPRPVRLRVEPREGHLVATYTDDGMPIPVPDFYDFGGGFYFTLLIGRTEHGVTITDDTGWLTAEGVLEEGELKGWLDFYPYPRSDLPLGPDGRRPSRSEVHQNWAPRLIKL